MKNVTRRSALGLLAATGGATLLAACGAQPQATSGNASGSASASASASKTARTDYSGVAVLEGYTSKPSDYQPATRTEPSKNAPVPTKPAVANENSVEGLYQSIAFFGAAIEYYMRTGKTEPLRECAVDNSELKNMLEPEEGTLVLACSRARFGCRTRPSPSPCLPHSPSVMATPTTGISA